MSHSLTLRGFDTGSGCFYYGRSRAGTFDLPLSRGCTIAGSISLGTGSACTSVYS